MCHWAPSVCFMKRTICSHPTHICMLAPGERGPCLVSSLQSISQCLAHHRNIIHICRTQWETKNKCHFVSWVSSGLIRLLTNSSQPSSCAPPLASLNIWSSSLKRLCSTWRRPLSSASRILRCRSASMAKAWILRSSCSLTSSLDRKSNMSASALPSSPAKWFSTRETLKTIVNF